MRSLGFLLAASLLGCSGSVELAASGGSSGSGSSSGSGGGAPQHTPPCVWGVEAGVTLPTNAFYLDSIAPAGAGRTLASWSGHDSNESFLWQKLLLDDKGNATGPSSVIDHDDDPLTSAFRSQAERGVVVTGDLTYGCTLRVDGEAPRAFGEVGISDCFDPFVRSDGNGLFAQGITGRIVHGVEVGDGWATTLLEGTQGWFQAQARLHDGSFLMAWSEVHLGTLGDELDLRVRHYDALGAPLGPIQPLLHELQFGWLQGHDGIALTPVDDGAVLVLGGKAPRIAKLDTSGALVGAIHALPMLASSNNAPTVAAVTAPTGDVLFAWSESINFVRLAVLDQDGTTKEAPMDVAPMPDSSQRLRFALTDSGATLAFDVGGSSNGRSILATPISCER
jgi:hypothetical protein